MEKARGAALVGRRVRVYWEGDDKWYCGAVRAFDTVTQEHTIVYDDGEQVHEPLQPSSCHQTACEWELLPANDEDAGGDATVLTTEGFLAAASAASDAVPGPPPTAVNISAAIVPMLAAQFCAVCVAKAAALALRVKCTCASGMTSERNMLTAAAIAPPVDLPARITSHPQKSVKKQIEPTIGCKRPRGRAPSDEEGNKQVWNT